MNPTQNPVTHDTVTPAATLRDAALYLARHGWHHGDMFANFDQLTPPACALGAIRMALYGTPHPIGAEDLTTELVAQFDRTVDAFAGHLIAYGYTSDLDEEDADFRPHLLVGEWNDEVGRTVTHVTAVMHAAANEWDRIHGGAR